MVTRVLKENLNYLFKEINLIFRRRLLKLTLNSLNWNKISSNRTMKILNCCRFSRISNWRIRNRITILLNKSFLTTTLPTDPRQLNLNFLLTVRTIIIKTWNPLPEWNLFKWQSPFKSFQMLLKEFHHNFSNIALEKFKMHWSKCLICYKLICFFIKLNLWKHSKSYLKKRINL